MLLNQFDQGASIAPTQSVADDAEAQTWRRFSVRAGDNISGDAGDDQYFSIDIVNLTNGQVDSSWTAGDYSTAAQAIAAFCTSLTPILNSRYTINRLTAYVMAFNPYSNSKPLAPTGPPDEAWTLATLGGGVNTVPAQPCSTVTELTPVRAHWGRFYLPTLGGNAYAISGHLTSSAVDTIANAAGAMYDLLHMNQLWPVVVSTQSNKAPLRALQGVTGIKVDDVPDVIRRRRLQHATYSKTLPVPAALQQPAA